MALLAEVQGESDISGKWLDGKTHKLRKKGLYYEFRNP
jgi:hypothetical protein